MEDFKKILEAKHNKYSLFPDIKGKYRKLYSLWLLVRSDIVSLNANHVHTQLFQQSLYALSSGDNHVLEKAMEDLGIVYGDHMKMMPHIHIIDNIMSFYRNYQ